MPNLVSTKELSQKGRDAILALAEKLEREYKKGKLKKYLEDKVIACIFFEPSTRTRLSFESAAKRLGAQVISTENAESNSSAFKGESIEDTARMLSIYADAIVMRHRQAGAAHAAAEVSERPIVNAGDGANEHPTQALQDVYTIKSLLGRLENLNIAYAGDLLYSRPLHSIMPLFSTEQKNNFYFISPPELRLPLEFRKALEGRGIKFTESEDWQKILPEFDVLYMTRVQKERFPDAGQYEKVKDSFILRSEHLKTMKKDAVIMHALPRVNEIEISVDTDPRAAYFRQAENGLYVRMAILLWCLGIK
ncbi:MAG: aspartate carbamoyltransferase [Patescibacteria group bacterium]